MGDGKADATARKHGGEDQEAGVHSSFPWGRRLCREHGHGHASAVPVPWGSPVSQPPAPTHPRTPRLPTWKGPAAGFVLLYRYLQFSQGGNDNPLQYSCLENPMDGGVWWATVNGVAKSRSRLSDFTLLFTLISL